MIVTLQIVLTVAEIVGLVAVLAVYLLVLGRQLRSVATGLAQVSARVREVEQRFEALGPAAAEVNWTLEELAAALPHVARKAEDLAARR